MSLTEVAAVAGVSASTVSRVLNDQHGVAPDTAEAVRVAMRKISFTPPARTAFQEKFQRTERTSQDGRVSGVRHQR